MEVFTVSFFGHREISNITHVEERLEVIVGELMESKEYVEFLVGRGGTFDWLASAAVRRMQRKLDRANSALVLVLPYMTAEFRNNEKGFYDYYNEIEICEKSARAHFKAAIKIRNRNMVERSDLVVCCIERDSGGAFEAVQYAMQKDKWIMNTVDMRV